MGARDFYKKGVWNAICDRCGVKRKSDEIRLEWDGLRVCKDCWEPRQPQDFVRGVADDTSVDWTRPEPPEMFINPGDVTPDKL